VPVPIEEFCVLMVDGEVALIAEENPLWKEVLVFKAGKKLWKVTKGAAAVTKYIPRYIKVNRVKLEVTEHAAQRMAQRGISEAIVEEVIKEGKKYYCKKYNSYIAWDKKKRIAVAFPKLRDGKAKRLIKTVMDNVDEDRKEKRWKKEEWRF
jgi:hypothetical protein